ncbi:MAG: endo-1,4-beta-xylanase [Bacteroidota bacterium]
MKEKKFFLLPLLVMFFAISCTQVEEEDKTVSLKKVFEEDFYMGVAINPWHYAEKDSQSVALIKKEFNSITAENSMKWMNIHPEPDTFNFALPDAFVEFGEENDMYIIGHTLVWHSQLADWVKEIKDSAEMAQHLEHHIGTIMDRYKGRVHEWDVVNEALNEDGTLRESVFLKVLGEDYLSLAFKIASEHDPDARLIYNDYNMTKPEKRDGAIRLIKRIQENGIKIDGVGLQAHWDIKSDSPTLEEIEESIKAYTDLGIEVSFTELDINVLPNPWDDVGADVNRTAEGGREMDPYTDGMPDSVQVAFNQRYTDIFELFLKYSDKTHRVTFWGLHDGASWKNNWPIRGRTNYPLLFNREMEPKEAYNNIIGLKKPDTEMEE